MFTISHSSAWAQHFFGSANCGLDTLPWKFSQNQCLWENSNLVGSCLLWGNSEFLGGWWCLVALLTGRHTNISLFPRSWEWCRPRSPTTLLWLCVYVFPLCNPSVIGWLGNRGSLLEESVMPNFQRRRGAAAHVWSCSSCWNRNSLHPSIIRHVRCALLVLVFS